MYATAIVTWSVILFRIFWSRNKGGWAVTLHVLLLGIY